MAAQGDMFTIPQFLQARTKEILVRAMLLNNISHGMEFDYFLIMKEGRDWLAWFRMPVDQKKFLVDSIRGADGSSRS